MPDTVIKLTKEQAGNKDKMIDLNLQFAQHKTVTKSYTIGGVGVDDCDFNFVTAANTTEQVIDLGAIIPALARVVDVFSHTEDAFVFSGGATTMVAEVGSSSSGNQYIASATIYAKDALLQPAVGASFTLVAISASAGHIYVAATPGANWSTNTAGKIRVYVTYIDNAAE